MENGVVPRLDIVFKTIFGDFNNIDLLKDLIKTYLGIDEEGEYALSNTEITPEELDSKFVQLDLHIKTVTKEIDVEIQVSNKGDFKERSLYYWTALCAASLKRGEPYKKLRPTFSLNILDFNLFEEDDHFFNKCTIENSYHTFDFHELMQMCYIELPKLKNYTPEQIKNDPHIAWAAFFKANREEEFNMLANTSENPIIQKAVTVVRRLSKDEEMIDQARRRWQSIYNERSAISAAEERGKKIGREEVIEENKEKLKRYFKAQGKSDEEIDMILRGIDNS